MTGVILACVVQVSRPEPRCRFSFVIMMMVEIGLATLAFHAIFPILLTLGVTVFALYLIESSILIDN